MKNQILFAGDCPSPLNIDPDVAFIGSRSESNLDLWMSVLGCYEASICLNTHTDELLKSVAALYAMGLKVVALGNNASFRLEKIGVKHFKLPHPSPKNRRLNDHHFVDRELQKCKIYVNSI